MGVEIVMHSTIAYAEKQLQIGQIKSCNYS